jgi:hypothetical protein
MIRDVEKIKKLPPRAGQSIMVKWLETGKIGGPVQAIQALCYECMGYYQDSELLEGDYGDPQCPLFTFNYYNRRAHPEFRKKLTPEQKQRITEQLKKGKELKKVAKKP